MYSGLSWSPRLRFIQQLTQEEGVNLAGVERIIALQRELERVTRELESACARMRRAEAAARMARETTRHREVHTALVRIQHGAVVRRTT